MKIHILNTLINMGADLNEPGKNGCSPLRLLLEKVPNSTLKLKLIQKMVQRGADCELKNINDNLSAYDIALELDDYHIVTLFEEHIGICEDEDIESKPKQAPKQRSSLKRQAQSPKFVNKVQGRLTDIISHYSTSKGKRPTKAKKMPPPEEEE